MVLNAEKKDLNEGYTVIKLSSGNAGIGLALISAAKSYDTLFTLLTQMSIEKENVLIGLCAKVIKTRVVPQNNAESAQNIAKSLGLELSNSIVLNQYSNPLAHYDQTAKKLIAQCDGKIDYVIMTAGTECTLSGINRKSNQKIPNGKIIVTDPYGGVLTVLKSLNINSPHPYKVEGNGNHFILKNCEKFTEIIDQWIKVTDKQSFDLAPRLIQEERMLVGGSNRTSMLDALEIARSLFEDKYVIVIFTDGIRNYLIKDINDDWMIKNDFLSQKEYDRAHYDNGLFKQTIPGTIKDLNLSETLIVKANQIILGDLIELFEEEEIQNAYALNTNKGIVRVLIKQLVLAKLPHGFADRDTIARSIKTKEIRKYSTVAPIYNLSSVVKRLIYPVEDKEENIYV